MSPGVVVAILRWIGYGLLAVVAALALLLFGARFSDGPIEIIAGGPFTSGETVTGGEPDWSFVRALDTVELQLQHPPRSRTTWIMEHDGRIFVPCGYMSTTFGKLWKKWPLEAEADGRAVLRVDGKLYPRHLVRLKSEPVVEAVVAELSSKYNVPATVAAVNSGALWLFELQPPRDGA